LLPQGKQYPFIPIYTHFGLKSKATLIPIRCGRLFGALVRAPCAVPQHLVRNSAIQ
jgi:hypothetical protein